MSKRLYYFETVCNIAISIVCGLTSIAAYKYILPCFIIIVCGYTILAITYAIISTKQPNLAFNDYQCYFYVRGKTSMFYAIANDITRLVICVCVRFFCFDFI